MELRGHCSVVELDLEPLIRLANLEPRHRPLPPFPAVVRDLSLVVDRSLPWKDLAQATRDAAGETLEALAYLDTFQGGNIPENRQSVHFSLTFRHPERTLTGEEVDRELRRVIELCSQRFGAQLRA
jgi:phenylalanyl-tRNA synthetase beta chain